MLKYLKFITFIFTIAQCVDDFHMAGTCNVTTLSSFRYPCGFEQCNPTTQYCEQNDGVTPHCAFCSKDVCNSDPSDYPGCKIACNSACKLSPPTDATSTTVTASKPSTKSSSYVSGTDQTTSPQPTPISCNNVKTDLKVIIILAILNALQMGVIAILLYHLCKRKRKDPNVEENSYKNKASQDDKLNEICTLKEGENVSIERVTERSSLDNNSSKASESGSQANTPNQNRRNNYESTERSLNESNSEDVVTSPKQTAESDARPDRLRVIANPQRYSGGKAEVYPSGK